MPIADVHSLSERLTFHIKSRATSIPSCQSVPPIIEPGSFACERLNSLESSGNDGMKNDKGLVKQFNGEFLARPPSDGSASSVVFPKQLLHHSVHYGLYSHR